MTDEHEQVLGMIEDAIAALVVRCRGNIGSVVDDE